MATILECSELTKKYGSHRAVDNLNLQIERGRVYALLGPNGSGKSTFMKMAAGLIHPSSGKILFEGESVGKNSKAKTVYMPTESYFYSYMTWKMPVIILQTFMKILSRRYMNSYCQHFHWNLK